MRMIIIRPRSYLLALVALYILIISLSSVNPVGESLWCCEKTTEGAWCQNAPESDCNLDYDKVPTSCEASAYCKLGWCYDSKEGTCLPNVPQRVCNEAGGVWKIGTEEPVQCTLGCCVIGDQAAFVTQTRCKKLSADYGLETNFRSDINTEVACLETVTSEVKGACVYEREFETTCRMTTQKERKELGTASQAEASFHAAYLCSAEDLATNCGPTEKTTCIEERDEVYFLDSCGNLANIYDATKVSDKEYWARIKPKSESCDYDQNNANDAKCGNCDYYFGSTCKTYEKSKDKTNPAIGNNICRDLSCKWEGKAYQHGETWCQSNSNEGNVPGKEDFRLVCYNNDVTIEACDAFRQQKCVQSETNGFKFARCVQILWQDCISQTSQQDCENGDARDCKWMRNGELDNKSREVFVCLPNYTPGFDFWNSEGEAPGICSVANKDCVAKFQKGLLQKTWKCDNSKLENHCECCVNGEYDGEKYEGCTGDQFQWAQKKENLCEALGDCGEKVSFIGVKGFANRTLFTRNGDAFEIK